MDGSCVRPERAALFILAHMSRLALDAKADALFCVDVRPTTFECLADLLDHLHQEPSEAIESLGPCQVLCCLRLLAANLSAFLSASPEVCARYRDSLSRLRRRLSALVDEPRSPADIKAAATMGEKSVWRLVQLAAADILIQVPRTLLACHFFPLTLIVT